MQTRLPGRLSRGDSIEFQIACSDYPSSDYSVELILKFPTPALIAESTPGIITESAANTVAFPQGTYPVLYRFTNRTDATKKNTVTAGTVTIMPNADEVRDLSTAELLLVQIDAAIKKVVQAVDSEVYVNGQSYTKQDLYKLNKLREETLVQVGFEAQARGEGKGIGAGVKIRTKFRRP